MAALNISVPEACLPVIGLGAGGHAKVVLSILAMRADVHVVGLLDADGKRHGQLWAGVKVLGNDTLLPRIYRKGVRHAFIGVGAVKDTTTRRRIFKRLCSQHFAFLDIIHPDSSLADDVKCGRGVTIMSGVIVNAGVRLGDNVVLNSGAIIEHDCRAGDHVMVSPGAIVCGGVNMGEGSFVGAGAVIREGVRLGACCVVGAGTVVISDVPAGKTVVGNPARVLVAHDKVEA